MATPFSSKDDPSGLSPMSAKASAKELDLEEDSSMSDSDDSLTAYGMYQGLVTAWRNEIFAPDILSYKGDYVECMLEVVKAMEESLKGSEVPEIVRSLHQLELERVRYVLSSYLRNRLCKMEKYADYTAAEDYGNLSSEEEKFLREYIEHMDTLFENLALRHMPPNLRTMDKDKAKVTPNLDDFVFARANENISEVMVEDDVIKFEKDSVHILKYSAVKSLVEKGRVDLI